MESVGSFRMNDGYDRNGVHTEFIFDGDQIVKKRTYDAEPYLKRAAALRAQTAGERWAEGTGNLVGIIPPAVLADSMEIQGSEERQKYILRWLKQNPAFVTFDKFLK